MTLVNDTVVIIGGMSSPSQYSPAVYILASSADAGSVGEMIWTELGNTAGPQPVGVLSSLLLYYYYHKCGDCSDTVTKMLWGTVQNVMSEICSSPVHAVQQMA